MSAAPEYAELHCHSSYSLLDGASQPEELVAQASALGLRALALTDHDGIYAAPTFCRLAESIGLRPIVGAELTLAPPPPILGGADCGGAGGHSLPGAVPTASLVPGGAGGVPLLGWLNSHPAPPRIGGLGGPIGSVPPTLFSSHLTLLAEDEQGYRNLCRLISLAREGRPKGEAALDPARLAAHSAGLIALSGCREGPVAAPLLAGQPEAAWAAAAWLREVFGADRCWIELQRHYLPGERRLLRAQRELAQALGLGVVATNDVHYHVRARHRLQDVLVAIRHRTPLDAAHHLRRPNAEYYLKDAQAMARLFAEMPEAVRNTLALAERCQARVQLAAYRFPDFPLPPGETTDSYLAARCWEGARARYGHADGEVGEKLRYELELIARHALAGYFLIVWDLMEFARRERVPAQGRGSAANSIVAYVLGLTNVDPIRHKLFVGRFLNEELSTLPDIDIDFSREHREQVLQYVYTRYGREHAALVSTHITYQSRSAVRDVGKVLGLPPDDLDRLARRLERYSIEGLRELLAEDGKAVEVTEEPTPGPERPLSPPAPLPLYGGKGGAGEDGAGSPPSPRGEGGWGGRGPARAGGRLWTLLLELGTEIMGLPRHLSQHVGGMVISSVPLVELVPLEPARMPGRVVTQWDKDGVQDSGLIKIDLLSLGMLSLVDEAVTLIAARTGRRLSLDALPLDDPAVYDLICRADTVGLFQIESRAQQQSLPRTEPRTFLDLVAQISLIRPGPLQGNMVSPYIRRRRKQEPVTYPHPKLEPVLEETLGVILYQEQCLRVAIEVAGFTAAEADALRRAMSRKRSHEAMAAMRERFVEGAVANEIDAATAHQVFDLLGGFAAYGFCKSHAAAFALLTYQSAWLRLYYPAEFYTALLNNQPMGFYSPEVIVNEAQRRGVPVLPVDVNRSRARCTVEADLPPPALRLGLRYVRGLGPTALARLDAERACGPYRSLADFCRRAGVPRAPIENLVAIGAFDSFGLARRELLWQLGLIYRPPSAQAALPLPTEQDMVTLPLLTPAEELLADYTVSGLSSRYHPIELARPRLPPEIATSTRLGGLRQGAHARVAGMIVCRQRPPTAKGFMFLTLEDEHGLMNVIVRPGVYARDRRTINGEGLVVVAGAVQRQDGVLNLMAQQVQPLQAASGLPLPRSHDYA
jgi:error-prone DNA polymerase